MARSLFAKYNKALFLLTGLELRSTPGSNQLTYPARNIPSAVCVAPPEDEEVMLESYRGP
jgi:hypothetical protein